MYRDKWKTNTGKIIPKAFGFQASHCIEKKKKILRLQGVEGDEFCSEWDWKKAATQHTQKVGPEYKLKAGDIVAVFVKVPVMKRLC